MNKLYYFTLKNNNIGEGEGYDTKKIRTMGNQNGKGLRALYTLTIAKCMNGIIASISANISDMT